MNKMDRKKSLTIKLKIAHKKSITTYEFIPMSLILQEKNIHATACLSYIMNYILQQLEIYGM